MRRQGKHHCCLVAKLCLILYNPAVCQASLSFIISQSLLKLISIESVMPSNHLLLIFMPPLLLPSIFPSIRIFSNELAPHIKWPKESISLKKIPGHIFLWWASQHQSHSSDQGTPGGSEAEQETLWGSWAPKPFYVSCFSFVGTSSSLHDLPRVPKGHSNSSDSC